MLQLKLTIDYYDFACDKMVLLVKVLFKIRLRQGEKEKNGNGRRKLDSGLEFLWEVFGKKGF